MAIYDFYMQFADVVLFFAFLGLLTFIFIVFDTIRTLIRRYLW